MNFLKWMMKIYSSNMMLVFYALPLMILFSIVLIFPTFFLGFYIGNNNIVRNIIIYWFGSFMVLEIILSIIFITSYFILEKYRINIKWILFHGVISLFNIISYSSFFIIDLMALFFIYISSVAFLATFYLARKQMKMLIC
ncbi:hypothetical protein A6A10_06750 [Otariodibacter oris]|uniref:Uncharacterized protein n=1 Tax=Otariodibacter oris TaxID=1032623 RepID=A0A420XGN3_9PAST|nr:hypothetical protein A6A10_06750 [Otariodibacter oris]RKR72676.1 hypothetical protein DES31_0840 [Otariodibacter oris]